MSNIEPAPRPLSPAEINWKTSQRIANTPFVPSAFRGKPESVFAAVLFGEEMGLGPMQSLTQIHVIEGKPSIAPELMRALVFKAGHRIDIKLSSETKAVLFGKRSDSGSEATVEWTMQDAQRAGLAGRGAWKTYPRAMLLARATSELCRMLFPDVVAGLSYTPEEAAGIAGVEWSPDNVTAGGAPAITEVTSTVPVTVEPEPEPREPEPMTAEEREWAFMDEFPGAEIVDAEIVEEPKPTRTRLGSYNERRPNPAPASDEPAPPRFGPGAPATEAQLKKIQAVLGSLGINDRNERLQTVIAVCGRELESSKDLTKSEATKVIDHLVKLEGEQ